VKDFLTKTHRKDAKVVKRSKSGSVYKFKIRCGRYLYTLKVAEAGKAEKVWQSLPPGLKKEDKDAKDSK
jgi:large subunit ribosomal protein L38e